MGKRLKRPEKEGQLTNFPEEAGAIPLGPRYLAVATSLILVVSALAALLTNQQVTGQATSTLEKWREEGLTQNWNRFSSQPELNQRDVNGKMKVSEVYHCPHLAKAPPEPYKSTSNNQGCFNAANNPNQLLAMCVYDQEVTGRIVPTWIQCIRA